MIAKQYNDLIHKTIIQYQEIALCMMILIIHMHFQVRHPCFVVYNYKH